jgi:hypothetical protein
LGRIVSRLTQDPKNNFGFPQPTLLILCRQPFLIVKKQPPQLEQRRFNRSWIDVIGQGLHDL